MHMHITWAITTFYNFSFLFRPFQSTVSPPELVPLKELWWRSSLHSLWFTPSTPPRPTRRRGHSEQLPPLPSVSSWAQTSWPPAHSLVDPWTRHVHLGLLWWVETLRTTGSTGLGLWLVVPLLDLYTAMCTFTLNTNPYPVTID